MKAKRKPSLRPFWVLPEREWAKVLGPGKARVASSAIEVRKDRLIVPIPQAFAAELAVQRRPGMRAHYSQGVLVVEPIAPKKRRRGT